MVLGLVLIFFFFFPKNHVVDIPQIQITLESIKNFSAGGKNVTC